MAWYRNKFTLTVFCIYSSAHALKGHDANELSTDDSYYDHSFEAGWFSLGSLKAVQSLTKCI
jgi:hypothetical protein